RPDGRRAAPDAAVPLVELLPRAGVRGRCGRPAAALTAWADDRGSVGHRVRLALPAAINAAASGRDSHPLRVTTAPGGAVTLATSASLDRPSVATPKALTPGAA